MKAKERITYTIVAFLMLILIVSGNYMMCFHGEFLFGLLIMGIGLSGQMGVIQILTKANTKGTE